MNRNEVPSAGIRARMAAAGIENAEILGTYDHPDHRGEADWRLTLWQVGDTRAAETNADPVFEDADPDGFAELLAEYGLHVVTARIVVRSTVAGRTEEPEETKMKIRFTGNRLDLHHPGVGDVAAVELRSYSHEDHEGLPWINGTTLIRPEDETATEMHARRLRHPDGSPVWVLNYRGRGFLTDLLGSAVAFVKVSLEEDGVISSPDNEGMA